MKPRVIVLVATLAAVVALGATFGRGLVDAQEKRKPWPKATPPEPPSPIYEPSKEVAPTEAQIAAEADAHNHHIAMEIERSLSFQDRHRREGAFTFLLPELLQVEPRRLLEMFAQQKPGEARDTLRTEIARQWISRDRDATIAWMKSLEGAERRAAAHAAVKVLASVAPEQALYVAGEFDLEKFD